MRRFYGRSILKIWLNLAVKITRSKAAGLSHLGALCTLESGFYYLQSRYYDPSIGRFINADAAEYSEMSAYSLADTNLFAYCCNNPINLTDDGGNLPSWATQVLIGTAVIAAAAVLTIATAGTGTALACFAVGALQGAITGAAVGAATGAATGAITHRVSTGSWSGAGQAALNGAATGYMTGAITGFVSGGLTSNVCFVAGTAVLSATGTVAIETIQPGDLVWAWDETSGDVSLKEVVETYVNETSELVHVFVNGEEIVCTNEHPFYSPRKGWTAACELRAGDVLVTVNGEYVTVEKIQHELLEHPIKVYNFEVADYHTYYVGNSLLLVHNVCGPLKGTDAVNAAKKLGFNTTRYYSHGQKVFFNPRTKMYITPDVDGHIGGVWKMAKSVRDLASRSRRLGTYDEFLRWIGR